MINTIVGEPYMHLVNCQYLALLCSCSPFVCLFSNIELTRSTKNRLAGVEKILREEYYQMRIKPGSNCSQVLFAVKQFYHYQARNVIQLRVNVAQRHEMFGIYQTQLLSKLKEQLRTLIVYHHLMSSKSLLNLRTCSKVKQLF